MATLPCHHCGYELSGTFLTDGMLECPECGKMSPNKPPLLPWWMESARHLDVALVAIGPACALLVVLTQKLGTKMWGYGWFDKYEWPIGIGTLLIPSVLGLVLTWRFSSLATRRGFPFSRGRIVKHGVAAIVGSTIACIVSYMFFAGCSGLIRIA